MAGTYEPGDDRGDWEVEVKIRRKGRLVMRDTAIDTTPTRALWLATTDLNRWADDQDADHDGEGRA